MATAPGRIVSRVDRLVAGGLVENDFQPSQRGESCRRQGAKRLEGALVEVENDESVGRVQQPGGFRVQGAAGSQQAMEVQRGRWLVLRCAITRCPITVRLLAGIAAVQVIDVWVLVKPCDTQVEVDAMTDTGREA